MSISHWWHKTKKGAKKTGKSVAKGATKVADKVVDVARNTVGYVDKAEHLEGKAFDKWNRKIESRLRDAGTGLLPSSIKRFGVDVGDRLVGVDDAVTHFGRKIASKLGAAPIYDKYKHFNPIGQLGTIGGLLNGDGSFLEAGFNDATGYDRGMFGDGMRGDAWMARKQRSMIGGIFNRNGKTKKGNGSLESLGPVPERQFGFGNEDQINGRIKGPTPARQYGFGDELSFGDPETVVGRNGGGIQQPVVGRDGAGINPIYRNGIRRNPKDPHTIVNLPDGSYHVAPVERGTKEPQKVVR